MRVSDNHTIIGGTTEVIDPIPGDHVGTPLVANEGANIDVTGLTIRAAGNDWGGNAIQMRTNVEEVTFDKCVLDIQSGNSLPVRMNQAGSATTPIPQITFEDVYFHDESTDTPEMVGVSPPGDTDNGATLTLPDASTARILSDNNDEFLIGTNGTLNVEGTTYTDTTVTASTLGLDGPLDSSGSLPEFHFECENPPEET